MAPDGLLLRVPGLERPGLAHGFTTRAGGTSEGPFASLNLAPREGEDPERVRANWRRVARALDPGLDERRVALLHQVHGAEAVRVTEPLGPDRVVAEADAAYTTEPGVVLAVRVADCVPVLVAGPGVVGVAHAGWRGAAGGVVAALVRAMVATGVRPGDLAAAVGPCIGPASFEVGPEVIDGLVASGVPRDLAFSHVGPRGKPHADLRRSVAHQLRALGVGSVDVVERCTVEDPTLFSHRRDGPITGRSAGVLVRTA